MNFQALPQSCVQLFLQTVQNLGYDALGVGIRQGAVVGPQLQRESHTLLAFGYAHAPVDVEQLHIPQQLSGGGGVCVRSNNVKLIGQVKIYNNTSTASRSK